MKPNNKKIKEYKKKWKDWKVKHNSLVIACPLCNRGFTEQNILHSFQFKCFICGNTTDKPLIRKKNPKRLNFRRRRDWTKTTDSMGLKHGYVTSENLALVLNASSPTNVEKYKGATYERKLRQLAFVSFIYLTGSRAGEIIGIRDKINSKKYKIKPFNRDNLFFDPKTEDRVLVVKDLNLLKQRSGVATDDEGEEVATTPKRTIKLFYDDDNKLMEFLFNYIDYMDKKNKTTNYFLFQIHHQTALRYLKTAYENYFIKQETLEENRKNIPYLHWLRHSRMTELTKRYKLNNTMITQFAGWTTTSMSSRYVHLDADDLLGVMRENR